MSSNPGDVHPFSSRVSLEEIRRQAEVYSDAFGERLDFDSLAYAEEYDQLFRAGNYKQTVQFIQTLDANVQSWHEHLRFVTVTYESEQPTTPHIVVYAGKIADYIAGKSSRTLNWDEFLNGDNDVDEMTEDKTQLAFVVRATERTEGNDTLKYWRESSRPIVNIPLESVLAIYKDKASNTDS